VEESTEIIIMGLWQCNIMRDVVGVLMDVPLPNGVEEGRTDGIILFLGISELFCCILL
jgi:hypothetical protein